MGTKNHPGNFDCHHAALPDEPMFVLLARDPAMPATVSFWIEERKRLGKDTDEDDQAKLNEAFALAYAAHLWRLFNMDGPNGIPTWREPRPPKGSEPDRPIRSVVVTGPHISAVLDDQDVLHITLDMPEDTLPRLAKVTVNDAPFGRVTVRSMENMRTIRLPGDCGVRAVGTARDLWDISDRPFIMLSASHISELLDYATAYGVFDENTPNGTTERGTSPMNDIRRGAIVAYKKVLGLIPEDTQFPEATEPRQRQVHERPFHGGYPDA